MNKKPVKAPIEQLTNQPARKITPLKTLNKGRRLLDKKSGLTKTPDRRTKDSERRRLDLASRSSSVRRYTIDRRTATKDRRAPG